MFFILFVVNPDIQYDRYIPQREWYGDRYSDKMIELFPGPNPTSAHSDPKIELFGRNSRDGDALPGKIDHFVGIQALQSYQGVTVIDPD